MLDTLKSFTTTTKIKALQQQCNNNNNNDNIPIGKITTTNSRRVVRH